MASSVGNPPIKAQVQAPPIPAPAASKIKKLIQKVRGVLPKSPPSPFIQIATESVYFGDADTKAPIQFLRDYAAEITDEEDRARVEELFRLFFEKGKFRQPETGPLCDKDDLDLVRTAIGYRFKTLRQKTQADLAQKGDTTGTRQLLGHLLELKGILEAIEEARAACETQAQLIPPPEAADIHLELPIDLDDAQIQELVRKFAFLILHAQSPLEGNERYDQPAVNIIEKLDSVEEIPEIETFLQTLRQSLEQSGDDLNPILEAILQMGVVGYSEYYSEVSESILEKLYTIVVINIQDSTILPQALKNAVMRDTNPGEEHAKKIYRIIDRLMRLIRNCDEEKLAQKAQFDKLTAAKKTLEGQVQSLQTQLKASEANLQALRADKGKGTAAAVEQERAAAEAQAKVERDRLTEQLTTAQGQVAGLTQQLAECNTKLEAAKGTGGALKTGVADLNRRIAELEEQLKQRDARNQELQEALTKQQGVVAGAQAASKAALTKAEGLEAQLTAFRTQAPADQAAAAEQAKRVGELQTQLRLAAETAAAKQAELQAATARAKQLQGELDAERQKAVESDAVKVQIQEQLDTHRQEKEGAVAAVDLTKQQLAAQQELVDRLKASLDAAGVAKAADAATIGKLRSDLARVMGAVTELEALKEAKAGVDAELEKLRAQLGEKGDAFKLLEAAAVKKVEDAERACLARTEAAKQEILANTKKQLDAAAAGSGAEISALRKQVQEKTAAEASAKQQGQAALENLRRDLVAKAAADAATAKLAAETKAAGEIDGLRKELAARTEDIKRLLQELEEAKKTGAASLQAKIEELKAAHAAEKGAILADATKKLGEEIARVTLENRRATDAAVAKIRAEEAGKQAESIAAAVGQAKQEAEKALAARLAAIEAENTKQKESLLAISNKAVTEKLAALTAQKDAEFAKKEAEIRAQMQKLIDDAAAARRIAEDSVVKKTTEFAEIQKLRNGLQKDIDAERERAKALINESRLQLEDLNAKHEKAKADAAAALVAKEAAVRKELGDKFDAERKALAAQLEEAKRAATASAMEVVRLTEEAARLKEAVEKGKGDVAALTARRTELESGLAAAAARAAAAEKAKVEGEARMAALAKEKDAALVKAKADLTAEFTAKMAGLTKEKDTAVAAATAAKAEAEKQLAMIRLERNSAQTAVGDMKKERNAATAAAGAATAAASAATAAQKKAVGERDAQLAKLRELAAEVTRGEFRLDKYAGPEDAPLLELLNKVKSLAKTPMVGNDVCVLMYFVTYFINTIFRANGARAQNFYGQIQGAVYTSINILKRGEAIKSETNLLFRLLVLLQPHLFLAEKVIGSTANQPSESALYLIRTDDRSREEFNEIFNHIKDMRIDTALATNLVKRRAGSGEDISFFPRADAGNPVLRSSSVMVYEPFSGSIGKPVDLRTDPGRRLLRYKVWENGALSPSFSELSPADLTAALPAIFRSRPITHDTLFCIYIVGAQMFLNSLDATKLKCPVPAELRDPFVGPLPVPVVAPPPVPAAGSDPYTSAGLTFGSKIKLPGSAAVPAAAALPPPAVPAAIDPIQRGEQVLARAQQGLEEHYKSIKCEKTINIPRAANQSKGIKLSDTIITTLSSYPFCFRDNDQMLAGTVKGYDVLQRDVTYNFPAFSEKLQAVYKAFPKAPIPVGFIRQPDGKVVPMGKNSYGLFDLSTVRGAMRGGARTEKKKSRGGNQTTRKNKTRNRR